MKIRPIVTVLHKGKLVSTVITNCDQCGELLDDFDIFIDDAVRSLYFCSDECKRGFETQSNARGHFPSVKLTLNGVLRKRRKLK